MKTEHRINWIRHYGGRPSSAPSIIRERHGLAFGSVPSASSNMAPRENEELDLAMTPSSRYRSLLVPVDGSPFGEHALPLALGIARRAGAEVRVTHVYSPMDSVFPRDRLYPDSVDLWRKHRQRDYLDNLVRRLAKVTSVPIKPVFREAREVTDSLSKAASVGTDLVVMATHGRGPLGRFWFGSVGDTLMRRLSVPLLFVRGYDTPTDLTGDPIMRHVLTTLDGSEASEKVLRPALALGNVTGAYHTLLRVIPWVDYSLRYSWKTPGSIVDSEKAEAWNYLLRVAKRLGRPSDVSPSLILDEDSTAQAILKYAELHDADLIALATRGQGGLSRVLQGSVADRVVRGASVPVLVCRQDAVAV